MPFISNFACCRGEPEPFINGLSACHLSHYHWTSVKCLMHRGASEFYKPSKSHQSPLRKWPFLASPFKPWLSHAILKVGQTGNGGLDEIAGFLTSRLVVGRTQAGDVCKSTMLQKDGHTIPLDTSPRLDNEFIWKTQREKYKQIPSLSLR